MILDHLGYHARLILRKNSKGEVKMNKKISAAFVTMLFILGIVSVPVSAHFTMGTHTGTYPFRTKHFDPHTDGVVGYVFPGSGLATPGAPGWYWGRDDYPGYQSPWPYYTGGVQNPFPAQGPAGWYQLDANNYAPFGAILTSTVKAGTPFKTMWEANKWASDYPTIEGLEIEHAVKGDMILAINVTAGQKAKWHAAYPDLFALNFTFWETLIPPEFCVGLATKNIVTSITNNYDLIGISTRNREDSSYGPYARRLRVYTDTYAFGADQSTFDKMDDAPDSWLFPAGPFMFSPWKTFVSNITFNIVPFETDVGAFFSDEWYYIRINDMTAPTIAGAYTFKIRRLYTPDALDGITYVSTDGQPRSYGEYVSVPSSNWPVVLVKGEVDPAIITGTIRYGGYNTAMYGQPVALSGRVRAVGIADDPYTGKSTGRPVEARGYFDSLWVGHYEVEGVAAGVYDIYASASGYPEIKIASNVKILKGQSYHIDGYLIPGVQIRGTVFSKCGTGETPWHFGASSLTDSVAQLPGANIKIEIYRSLEDAQSMLPGGTTSKAVTWSPIKYGAQMWTNSKSIWPYNDVGVGLAFYYPIEPTSTSTAPLATRTAGGVGPAQNWFVLAGMGSFDFQFGREGFYGAPADMDCHVPGALAHWVSGVGPGTYFVRAWKYGYVQTLADGVTFEPVSFTVPSVEWPGNVWVPFDLRLSSYVVKEVHFHDVPGTMMESPIPWGWSGEFRYDQNVRAWMVGKHKIPTVMYDPYYLPGDYPMSPYFRFLCGELVGTAASNYKNAAGENVQAWDLMWTPVGVGSWRVGIAGFRELGLWYGFGRNYGIPAGTYTAKSYMWGYVEQVYEKVTLGLCGTAVLISEHMYRGAKFNLTLYSKDWQHPTVDKEWAFPYMPIYVQIMKDGKQVAPFLTQYVMPTTMQGFRNTSVAMWPYMWNNPIHMIKLNDAVGQVFGWDAYTSDYGPWGTYFQDYFGPSNMHYALYSADVLVLTDCESAMGWTSNAPNVATGNAPAPKEGSWWVGAWPGPLNPLTLKYTFGAMDWTDRRYLNFWANTNAASGKGRVKISDGTNTATSAGITYGAATTWKAFSLDLATFTGLVNLASITSVQFELDNADADDGLAIDYVTLTRYRVLGAEFRYYDGSEAYNYMYYGYFSSYGLGPCVANYPLSFETGIYDFKALTYGYVQKKTATVAATKGDATADILIKLTVGAEMEMLIKLKHQGIFEHLPFDAHLRIRVLDDKNTLVGEYLTSDWWWQPQYNWQWWKEPLKAKGSLGPRWGWNLVPTTPPEQTGLVGAVALFQLRYGTLLDQAIGLRRPEREYWRLNYVPASTESIIVKIAGLPDMYGWVGGYSPDPCPNTGNMGYEDKPIDAPYGIDGYPNYKGGWKLQVHIVPLPKQPPVRWNAGFSNSPSHSTDPSGGLGWMLTGELYYDVKADGTLVPVYTNHLGPYELRYNVVIPGTHLGGESSLNFELDRRGYASGTVVGYTYCDDWRSTSWTTVQFVAADGTTFNHYTFDGTFGAWLPAGPYTAAVVFWTPAKQEGYKAFTMPYHVSDGSVGAFNVYLEQSGVPIPEFPATAIVLASALAASLFILRRRKRTQ